MNQQVAQKMERNLLSRQASRTPAWERRYGRKLIAADAFIVFGTLFGAQVLRFGGDSGGMRIPVSDQAGFVLAYSAVSFVLALGWMGALAAVGSRDPRVVGTGPTEYKRVMNATFLAFGGYAIIAFSVRADLGRGYLLIALPVGLILLLLSRWIWRKRLHQQRRAGLKSYRALVVGESDQCDHIASEIMRDPNAGFEVIGAVTRPGTEATEVASLPVVGNYDDVLRAVDRLGIDTLIMTSPDSISPERMQKLGWELEQRGVDLIVTVALTDIAGSRYHSRPVSGLPLIHVEHPKFSGHKQTAKRLFDVVAASILVIVTAPIMLVVACAVKFTSSGPVFYHQERVGLGGNPFPMFKFRSMVQNADAQLHSLLADQGTSDSPLHKVENDPRITPVGRFIRKYSLDELPQLFNVLLGTMTLVGPRPQRESEVELYDEHHFRRLLVKPGITGLWQVSGRSDLSWEDSVRLDLYYAENWSMLGDLVILLRTVKTVISPEGAY